jgi:hypothetical protein
MEHRDAVGCILNLYEVKELQWQVHVLNYAQNRHIEIEWLLFRITAVPIAMRSTKIRQHEGSRL